jgi:hypothetical protein
VSSYKTHLERYLKVFPRDRLLVLLNEDMTRDPGTTLRRVYDFVGVDEDFVPRTTGIRFNVQRRPRILVLEKRLVAARASRMRGILPKWGVSVLGSVVRTVRKMNAVRGPYPPLAPETRQRLVRLFDADIGFVEELLGRELPGWRAAD